jgi:hypothetical protein
MHCVSVKPGVDCTFMTKKGCSFNGGKCKPVVEACNGCERILGFEELNFCASFPDPDVKWRLGICNLATHVKNGKKEMVQKLNPLKASKRKATAR